MSSRCDITVVMPTYNRSNFIKGAIESVLRQTCSDFTYECIVVDDGSTDNTYEVIKSYIDSGKIKYIRKEVNSGISNSLNTGIKEGRGRYICWLSDDDRWFKNKLVVQFELAERYGYKLIYSDYVTLELRNNSNKVWISRVYVHKTIQESLKRLFSDCFINGCTVMIRREVFDEIGYFSELEENKWNQDLEYWFRIMLNYKDNDIRHINMPLVLRTNHDKMASVHWCGYKNNILFDKVLKQCKIKGIKI